MRPYLHLVAPFDDVEKPLQALEKLQRAREDLLAAAKLLCPVRSAVFLHADAEELYHRTAVLIEHLRGRIFEAATKK